MLGVGCVIPLAPDFEDPEANFPPYMVSSIPASGEVVTVGNATPAFMVTLGDPNVGDTLYVKWLFDYPKWDETYSRVGLSYPIPPSPNREVQRTSQHFQPSCADHNIARGITEHRLTLAVADRPFLLPEDPAAPSDYRLDAVGEGTFLLRATWIIKNLECLR